MTNRIFDQPIKFDHSKSNIFEAFGITKEEVAKLSENCLKHALNAPNEYCATEGIEILVNDPHASPAAKVYLLVNYGMHLGREQANRSSGLDKDLFKLLKKAIKHADVKVVKQTFKKMDETNGGKQ